MRKLTLEEFISNSQKKHGNKYDYSKSVYINKRSKILIICPEHGEFFQNAGGHMAGYGCPVCSGNKKHTLESFIQISTKAHKGKFDYSKTVFKNTKGKVKIICPIHGEFEQIAQDHMRGVGCNQCRLNKSVENEYIPNKKEMREYSIWGGIKTRTTNPNSIDYNNYGGRGITCCEKWLNSFEDFYADMGECPEGYTIDRINNDGDYSLENCRWAPMTTQANNRGSFNILIEFKGKTQTLKMWADELNINYNTLYNRINRSGLSFEEAIQDDPFNKQIEMDGKSHTLKEWCEIYDIKFQTVINRIHKHKWEVERAITTPHRNNKIKNKI